MSDRVRGENGTWLGWHWLAEDRRLRYGTREFVRAGHTYTAEGRLRPCKNGMHASRRALDALWYAPGPVICRVELLGERVDDTDKSVARSRRVLWMADATRVLHEFVLTVATDVLSMQEARGEAIDERSWRALDLQRAWLAGRATDAELDAVWTAAWTAAWDTAWAAARDSARAAARAAAPAAAPAAWGAARDAQNTMLETKLEALR